MKVALKSLGSARVSRAGFGVSPKRTFLRMRIAGEGSRLRKVRDRGTQSPARETRALPRVVVAALLVVIGVLAGIWLCLPKPPLMDDISFSRRVFDREGHQLRMTL